MNVVDLVLQQVTSDEAAVHNLPFILSSLLPPSCSAFSTPSSSHKLWIARVNSLQERPKHPGARWAGFSLAQRTAQLSRDLLLTSAENWISCALPALSRDEPLPVLNASIHLLATIYTAVPDMPEFHRRVVVPTVQKFSLALMQLAEKPQSPVKLKALCLHTLIHLVHQHPNLHVALHARLLSLTLSHLSGSYPSTSENILVQSAADLHSVLHLTGGKVRGATAWRKSVDSTVSSALSALSEVTSTFGIGRPFGSNVPADAFEFHPFPADNYQMSIAIAVDRLRSLSALLVSLLRCSTPRPVSVPVGALANLTLRMISVNASADSSDPANGFVDPGRRIMEHAVVPTVWEAGCTLLIALSESATRHITPYVSQLASAIVLHLDDDLPSNSRLRFLDALIALVSYSHPYPITNAFLSTRILKSLLPCLSNLLTESILPSSGGQNGAPDEHRGAKAKKKAKIYEGGEVFRITKDVLLRSSAEGEEVLATLHLLPPLISSPHTDPAAGSVASRVLLSVLLHIPSMAPTLVSSDPSLHTRIFEKVIWACEMTILHDASNPWLRRGLGLIAQVIKQGDGGVKDAQALRSLSLLIHPHLPPTLRTLSSSLENIPLYRSEGKEERDTRQAMKLVSLEDRLAPTAQPGPQVVTQENHLASADAMLVEQTQYTSRVPTPPPAQTNEPPAQNSSESTAGTAAPVEAQFTNQPTPTSSFSVSWTAAKLPSSDVVTPNTSFSGSVPAVTEKAGSLTHKVANQQVQASSSTTSTQANQQDFVPFDVDGNDDSDNDAPIPEIDMRSDSGDEE